MKIAIVIPARYGSSRFPGKPLAKIGDKSMLAHVVDRAREAAKPHKDVEILVATEDERILDHCREIGVNGTMTSENCPTGSDRVLDAMMTADLDADFLINFQGDTPFTPPAVLTALIDEIESRGDEIDVVTPVHFLSWEELDKLRENKKTTPFSGTTAVMDEEGHAFWFSKQILPAIRKERALRESDSLCPVAQHIGIYGYRRDILERFVTLPEGYYEQLEGLEQLRLIENGIKILAVPVTFPEGTAWKKLQGGIDSPEDIQRAEKVLKQFPDFLQ